MMHKMIRLGYTPGSNIRSLQRLMLLHENGKMITDEYNDADILLLALRIMTQCNTQKLKRYCYSLTQRRGHPFVGK